MSGSVTKFVNSIEPVKDFAKDNVAPIQPARDNSRNKELGAVGIRASICHGQKTGLRVFQSKVLIREFSAVAVSMSD